MYAVRRGREPNPVNGQYTIVCQKTSVYSSDVLDTQSIFLMLCSGRQVRQCALPRARLAQLGRSLD